MYDLVYKLAQPLWAMRQTNVRNSHTSKKDPHFRTAKAPYPGTVFITILISFLDLHTAYPYVPLTLEFSAN